MGLKDIGKKRSATLQEDGTVLLVADRNTERVVPYDESLHDAWPDLERPKKRRKRKVVEDDNSEGDAGLDVS